MGKSFKVLDLFVIGLVTLLFLFFIWLFLPPLLVFNFASSWIILILYLGVVGTYLTATKKGMLQFFLVIPILMIVVMIGYTFFTSAIFTHEQRYALIGDIEEKEFSEEIKVIDTSRLRILDSSDALRHAENRLGSESGIGSQFELREGDFTLQTIDGHLYWVAPLQYRGFFKWRNNPEGAEGYIMVNANTRETKWVRDYKIKYSTSAYWGNDIHRHVYNNFSRSKGYTDFSFEVDDTGRPHYIITVYDNTIGFGGSVVEGILVVDAVNGEITFYEKGSAYPQWVDRVVPESFFARRLKDWGRYPNGWFNPSNQGQLKLSSGRNIVYNQGKAYYYTGITSWGADEATVGFMLMDTRTGETTFYRISGATETKAMAIAEGRVQNAGYRATPPVLISVGGHPTYFMTLKDSNNNIAEYAFVNVEDFMRSGVSRNIETAQAEYMVEIGLRKDTDFIIDESQLSKVEGVVERINMVIVEGDTYYYIKLQGNPNLYKGSFKSHVNLVITEKGDTVTIQYLASEDNTIRIFKNHNIEE